MTLLYTSYIIFRYSLCSPNLSRTFIKKQCWIDHMICFPPLSWFIWWITITYFQIMKDPCLSGMRPSWSWWIVILMCSQILFVKISSSEFIRKVIQNFGIFCDICVKPLMCHLNVRYKMLVPFCCMINCIFFWVDESLLCRCWSVSGDIQALLFLSYFFSCQINNTNTLGFV